MGAARLDRHGTREILIAVGEAAGLFIEIGQLLVVDLARDGDAQAGQIGSRGGALCHDARDFGNDDGRPDGFRSQARDVGDCRRRLGGQQSGIQLVDPFLDLDGPVIQLLRAAGLAQAYLGRAGRDLGRRCGRRLRPCENLRLRMRRADAEAALKPSSTTSDRSCPGRAWPFSRVQALLTIVCNNQKLGMVPNHRAVAASLSQLIRLRSPRVGGLEGPAAGPGAGVRRSSEGGAAMRALSSQRVRPPAGGPRRRRCRAP